MAPAVDDPGAIGPADMAPEDIDPEDMDPDDIAPAVMAPDEDAACDLALVRVLRLLAVGAEEDGELDFIASGAMAPADMAPDDIAPEDIAPAGEPPAGAPVWAKAGAERKAAAATATAQRVKGRFMRGLSAGQNPRTRGRTLLEGVAAAGLSPRPEGFSPPRGG